MRLELLQIESFGLLFLFAELVRLEMGGISGDIELYVMHTLDKLARRVLQELCKLISFAFLRDERMFPYELAFIIQRTQLCKAQFNTNRLLGILFYKLGADFFVVKMVFNLPKAAPQIDTIREDAVCCPDDGIIEVFPVDVRILFKF